MGLQSIPSQRYGILLLALLGWLGMNCDRASVQALSQPQVTPLTGQTIPAQVRRRYTCPTEVKDLTTLLLRDLPGYANRVSLRALRRFPVAGQMSYVLTAGRPEFEPLPLGPGQLATDAQVSQPANLRQVFITTLERQSTAGKEFQLQQYHWLFLVQTEEGWRLATMYSRTGPYPATSPPTPPRESSDGVIGRAVQNWLSDCRAGAIRP